MVLPPSFSLTHVILVGVTFGFYVRRCACCCRMFVGGLGKSAVDADSHFGSFGGSSSRQGFPPLVETTLGRMDAFGRAVC